MRRTLRQLAIDTAYNLSSFPITLAAFIISIVGLGLGVGTAVIWIGVPIMASTLLAMRGLAAAGRAQIPSVIRREISRPRYKRAKAESSALRRFLTVLTDGQSWLNLLWAITVFPVAVIGFAVSLAWWAATLAVVTWPLYGWIVRLASGPENTGPYYATVWLGWGGSYL